MSEPYTNGNAETVDGVRTPRFTLPPRSVMAVQELVANQIRTLARMAREAADERRDIDKECGHPKGVQSAHWYQDLYDSDAISARVVEVLPRECWQVTPQVYEVEDAEVITPFEEAWDNLSRSLYGEHNYPYFTVTEEVPQSDIARYPVLAKHIASDHKGLIVITDTLQDCLLLSVWTRLHVWPEALQKE